jgi:hypothetical protein
MDFRYLIEEIFSRLVGAPRAKEETLHWKLINDYLTLLTQQHRLADIKAWHDPTQR